ncbi:Premnaspirodiene oxygenase [Capsicum chinense]|nr:Premnaspirodiene oxygenase [Capsicum chinense]
MRTVAGAAGVFDLANLFPSVKMIHFISGFKYKLRKMHDEVDVLLEEIINEHEFHDSETTEEDIVDVLLRLQKSQNFSIPITRDKIKCIIIFAGGSTTSASTTEWAFSELMKNPKIMEKAQDEVREVFKGKENGIDQTDIQKLKHLKMVVKEILRRMWPGSAFARATVEISMALLLYHFDWKLPNGMNPHELDMTEKFGRTLERKNNLILIPLPHVHA